MKLLKRIVLMVLVVLIGLIVVGGAGGYWFATKSHPQIDGTLQVKGLKAKVEVVRDSMGVPHIYASNIDDLFFAQGYIQAQDRLWQMELNRHIGQGRTAELSGPSAVNTDKFLRTIGLYRAAQADWQAAGAEDQQVLTAFANGVNAFVDTHKDNLPLEFTLIGIKWEPWQPTDTLVWAKVMALDLGGNRSVELLRSRLIEKLGVDKASELMPSYPKEGPFIIPPEAKKYADAGILNSNSEIASSQSALLAMTIGNPNFASIQAMDELVGIREGIGSNNWVIDGSKTTTGKPILANDPHLGIQIPSIWYMVGLHCETISIYCPYNMVGAAFPPAPGVIIGHNDRIAWGVTNTGPDVQDFFIEKLNPANPNQYEYQGKFEDFQIIKETLKVKGGADQTIEVKISRHGPILTPVLDGVTQPLALQWTALKEKSSLWQSVMAIDRAQNWNEFRAALKSWDAPSQNFVYADVDGNIGYQMPGNIPIRGKGDGSVPVPGWTGEYDWKGYVPYDELPFVYNPPTHYIATANHAVVPTTYKYLITLDWSVPYRAQRINDMIRAKDKLSTEDIAAIQSDVTAIPLQQLQKYVSAIKSDKPNAERALDAVKHWDGVLSTDNTGGAILEATYQRIVQNTFKDDLGDLFDGYYGSGGATRLALSALYDKPTSAWWDNASTSQKETRDDILTQSFEQALGDLTKYGSAPSEWNWGKIHTATFAHPVGSVKPMDLLFNAGPIAVPGYGYTVNNTGYSDPKAYSESSVPSLRFIHDLSNWNNLKMIHTTGQSGQPLNKHYTDMVLLWRDAKYVPFPFDRTSLDKIKQGAFVMQP